MTTGDPLADAVVAEMRELGPRTVRPLLEQGIRDGLASLTDPPPALDAFLTATEAVPVFVDDQLLDLGSRPQYTSPPAVHAVSLSIGALIRVCSSPTIADVLTTPGRLAAVS